MENKSPEVYWQNYTVSKQDRTEIKGHKSCIIWLTGLPSSGKSTIANDLAYFLNKRKVHTYVLDGDNIRHGLNGNLGFSPEDRTENIRRIGEVAKLFSDAGLIAIAAFISPYRKDRDRIRSIVEEDEFIEVHIKCPVEECEQRDVKGLYKKAREGIIKQFTGIDAPYEQPENPEIEIDTKSLTPEKSAQSIVEYLEKKGYIQK